MVLFERTSKGISLTRQGEAFLKDTQLLTNIYQDLDDKYKNHKGNASIFAYPPCTMSPVSMPLSILYASLRIRNIIWAILRATWIRCCRM